jgi:hypothetical protein
MVSILYLPEAFGYRSEITMRSGARARAVGALHLVIVLEAQRHRPPVEDGRPADADPEGHRPLVDEALEVEVVRP